LGQGIIASGRAPGSSAPGHGPSICGHHVSRTETDGDRDIHVNQAQPGRHCPSWFIRGQHLQGREVPLRPRAKGTRNAGPIGSRVTSNSEDQVSQKPRPGRGPRRTHPARLGPSPGQPIHLRPVTAWISTRCTSLQFFLSASEATRGTIIFPFVEVIAPRPSHLVFSRPPALWGSGGALLTGSSRATHAWDRLSAGTPAHAVTAVTAVPVL